jgi:hypothetical protein
MMQYYSNYCINVPLGVIGPALLYAYHPHETTSTAGPATPLRGLAGQWWRDGAGQPVTVNDFVRSAAELLPA